MINAEIVDVFEKIAVILEIQNANRFRIRAYQQAAVMIEGLTRQLSDIYKAGGTKSLCELSGIGEDLALKIEEMIKTGKLKYFLELKKKVPSGLLKVMEIEGMGPKRTELIFKKFSVKDIKGLEKLLESGKLEKIVGWGKKSVENIQREVGQHAAFGERQPLHRVLPLAEQLVANLKKSGWAEQVEIAGSLRRCKETIGDIDILATSKTPEKLVAVFAGLPEVCHIMARGPTKCLVTLKNGLDADLRVLPPREFGAGLYYFTGSKSHNVAVRTMGVKKGLTISEYGVFRGTKERKGKYMAGRTEEEIFKTLGLDFIPPELRENAGEIEAALNHKLPQLITEEDIQGDLHLHSKWSDGGVGLSEMVRVATEHGLKYMAMTDHASVMGMVKGVKKENYDKYIGEVRAVAKKVSGIQVLAGAEVDILPSGVLYLEDSILKKLDWVLAAVHGSFKMSKADMTKRILKALKNPYVHGLAHPTTRLLQKRAPIDFDMIEVMKTAAKHKKVLELDGSPYRLDLNDMHCRLAKEYGVKIVIDSDAHNIEELELRYGVATARRGWLEKGDVLNTWPWEKVKRWLRRS